MGIKVKGRFIFRIIGALMILLGLVLFLFLNYAFIDDVLSYLLFIMIIAPWIVYSMMLKIEIDLIVNNFKIIFIFLILCAGSMLFVALITNLKISLIIIINSLLTWSLIVCWHFSLSIYRIRKLIFLISGIGFIIGLLLLSMQKKVLVYPLLNLVIIFISSGMVLILGIEYNLKKKGYLNYI